MFPDCSGAATEDCVIVSFAGCDKTSSSEFGSRTRHQCELAHTSHLRRKCAARRVWKYMFGPCTERCTADVASSLTWFGDVWSVHGEMRRRGSLRPSLGWRLQDKLRDLLHRSPHAYNPRERCRHVARCVVLLPDGMVDLIFDPMHRKVQT